MRALRSIPAAACVAAAILAAGSALAAPLLPQGLRYASPPPGARYVRNQTSILLRADHALAGPGTALIASLTVTGSQSGEHAGAIILSRDGTLVRFIPSEPFSWGEQVTVAVAPPIAARGSYAFLVSKTPPPAAPPAIPGEQIPQAGLPDDWGGLGGSVTPAGDTSAPRPPTLEWTATGRTAPGMLYLTSFRFGGAGDAWLLQVADSGAVVHARQTRAGCFDFKQLADGRLSYYDGAARKFYILDANLAVTDSIAGFDGYTADLHELSVLPDGHVLFLCYDPETVDMSEIVPGGNPAAVVTGAIIQELDETGELVFVWRSWDHFEVTDATHLDMTAASIDYAHSNAIEVDGDGNLLLSSRHMDEITKIDRDTGETLWRWGGPHNEFTFLGDSIGFSRQHAIRRLRDGHMILFDNGNFHTPPFSRAVEYELDETAKTARLVWEHRADPLIYGAAMGYAQRLSGGHTLIGWGAGKPDVTEVDAAGNVVMSLSLPAGLHSYRAYRFVTSAAETLTPESAAAPANYLSANRPNPFSAVTQMWLSLPTRGQVTLEVYDVTGRKVRTILDAAPRMAGVTGVQVDLTGMPRGVYTCLLRVGSHAETRRLVLTR